jgi:uncharacterized membrane protein YdbT with pleckstrin-like domain
MSYLDKILQPDEQVLVIGKKHWIIYLPGISVLILAIIIEILGNFMPHFAFILQIVALIVTLLAIVLLFREWFDQFNTEIVVTNKRVVYKRGFISRFTREMNMEKIESVAVDQTLLGRILSYGTIDIRGTGAGIEQLRGIASPLALRNAINTR